MPVMRTQRNNRGEPASIVLHDIGFYCRGGQTRHRDVRGALTLYALIHHDYERGRDITAFFGQRPPITPRPSRAQLSKTNEKDATNHPERTLMPTDPA